jgi:hypothetical protein
LWLPTGVSTWRANWVGGGDFGHDGGSDKGKIVTISLRCPEIFWGDGKKNSGVVFFGLLRSQCEMRNAKWGMGDFQPLMD